MTSDVGKPNPVLGQAQHVANPNNYVNSARSNNSQRNKKYEKNGRQDHHFFYNNVLAMKRSVPNA
jgi:hypothetical protein